ncbi:MAG: hypothetical protein GTO40_02120 [Deltaproteobacteria bacterium]|nr:hypothetical protein [Deltaproteobacteria bacterium]
MPIRRGQEYLESLRDGRQVWLRGQKVDDVTSHPALAGFAKTLAEIYDLQHDSANQEYLTMRSPSTGDIVSLGYLLPQSTEDLVRVRRMTEFLQRRCGGVAARLPHYMATMLLALYDMRDILGERDPGFASNIAKYFEYCREKDLCLTVAFGDPQRPSNRPPTDFEFLKVVERRPDGIVISGCKPVATLAPYADEFLGLVARPGQGVEDVIYFAVPLNTKGLKVVCRQPMAPEDPQNHPLSAFWDEMDASLLFDHVFVPNDRVFFYERVTTERIPFLIQIFIWTMTWTFYHTQIRKLVKLEVLAGICKSMADYLGSGGQPHVQDAISDLIVDMETLRALITAAENNPTKSRSGLAEPDLVQLLVAHMTSVDRHPKIIQHIREVCGSGPLMAPGHDELVGSDLGPEIRRYFVGKDEAAPDRFRMLRLAWEYTCESFGSRQVLFEMYNSGAPAQVKMRLLNAYDLTPYVRLAKDLAGISG